MKAINLGAGDIKIDGVESHDINQEFKCDYNFDLRVSPWPLEHNTYDEVYFFHCIEHIEKKHHKFIFSSIWNALKPEGIFILSFPEFEIIINNWYENKQGMREFWEANIYGLQRTPSDYHVCAMDATETAARLLQIGFKDVQISAELNNHHNTVIRCLKGEPQKTYEQVVYEDVIR